MISTEGTAEAVLARAARWHVGHGDCLDLMRELPEASVDALITDPPAAIGFMGKDWDDPGKVVRGRTRSADPDKNTKGFLPGYGRGGTAEDRHKHRVRSRDAFIPWLTERFSEAYRVLKPGAHGLIWSLPRTTHWTGMAADLAGFEIIDQIQQLFSQGASKSKSARRMLAMDGCDLPGRHYESALPPEDEREEADHVCADYVEPTEWDGHGTGLAPSHESWYLVRKPLEGTIAENLTKWGTGVIDIDGSRIPVHGDARGRWPKNVVIMHGDGCVKRGTAFIDANPSWDTPGRDTAPALFTGSEVSKVRHVSREGEASAHRRYTGRGSASMARTPGARRDELEEVDVWECELGCPARELGLAVGRFYLQLREEPFVPFRYEPKPTRSEKDAGLRYFRRRSAAEATKSKAGQARLRNARTGAGRTGGARNVHATVKGEKWMRYCTRLVCPAGGVELDLFAGSGSTGVGAVLEGRRFIGFEMYDSDAEPHVSIARARIHFADGSGELVPRESLRVPMQPTLFTGRS